MSTPKKSVRGASVQLLPAGHPARVPAAQINVMHGPNYTQKFSPPVRPGALDFKRIPSKLFAKE